MRTSVSVTKKNHRFYIWLKMAPNPAATQQEKGILGQGCPLESCFKIVMLIIPKPPCSETDTSAEGRGLYEAREGHLDSRTFPSLPVPFTHWSLSCSSVGRFCSFPINSSGLGLGGGGSRSHDHLLLHLPALLLSTQVP